VQLLVTVAQPQAHLPKTYPAERRRAGAKSVLHRTGSASRRAAARSGLYWNPGLPRSGALATVPQIGDGKTSGERAGPLSAGGCFELLGECEKPHRRHGLVEGRLRRLVIR
jgi:hypothetical protein